MNEHIVNTMKRTALLLALALVPVVAFAEPPSLRLDDGGGARYYGGRASLGAPVGGWSVSPQIALSIPDKNLDVGPRFTLEGMYAAVDLAPSVRLDIGPRGSFAYHSFDGGSYWAFDMLPDLKLRFAPSSRVGLYGDFGVGLAMLHASDDFGGSDTRAAATIQFGFGAAFALSPGLNLTTEVRFNFYTRSGSPTLISIPTVGLEFF
jgi:opacity protein-like surface antigen